MEFKDAITHLKREAQPPMLHFFALWALTAIAFMITAYVVPGFQVSGFLSALTAAAVFGLINALVRPLLVFLTFPITVVTLGAFLLVVNAICLLIASAMTPGFEIRGFWAAVLGWLVLSLVSWGLNRLALAV
jgi:putative membrane protein